MSVLSLAEDMYVLVVEQLSFAELSRANAAHLLYVGVNLHASLQSSLSPSVAVCAHERFQCGMCAESGMFYFFMWIQNLGVCLIYDSVCVQGLLMLFTHAAVWLAFLH